MPKILIKTNKILMRPTYFFSLNIFFINKKKLDKFENFWSKINLEP